MRIYVLYGFGVLLCVSGVGYLAAEYIKFLSEIGKLCCLVLVTAMFAFFGKFLETIGW
jgi:hypothetical protein